MRLLGVISMMLIISAKSSNYNAELIELHRNLSHFQYDLHAMPSSGGYRKQHTLKHFVGKRKPLNTFLGEEPYGRRNTAAIVDIITQPNNWELCEATDKYAHKLGLWNEQWKLFMVFGYVSIPIKGQNTGVLVSAYVEKLGKRKLRCNWDHKNYKEFQLLQKVWKERLPRSGITLNDVAQPITLGVIVAGITVMGEEALGFLSFMVLSSF